MAPLWRPGRIIFKYRTVERSDILIYIAIAYYRTKGRTNERTAVTSTEPGAFYYHPYHPPSPNRSIPLLPLSDPPSSKWYIPQHPLRRGDDRRRRGFGIVRVIAAQFVDRWYRGGKSRYPTDGLRIIRVGCDRRFGSARSGDISTVAISPCPLRGCTRRHLSSTICPSYSSRGIGSVRFLFLSSSVIIRKSASVARDRFHWW